MEKELRQHLIEAVQSLDKNQLLCEIDVTDQGYLQLIEYAKSCVLQNRFVTLPPPDEILSLALVQIGFREYEEGNYWDNFDEVLGAVIDTQNHCYLGQILFSTLKKYGFYIDRIRSNQVKNNYVQTILIHGFVPKKYLIDFFEFVYSYYERNLFRTIPQDLDETFDELSIYMLDTLKSVEDSIRLKPLEGHPTKSYKLLKATRKALANEGLISTRKILEKVLRWIDTYYWDNVFPEKDENNMLSSAFVDWLLDRESLCPKEARRERSSNNQPKIFNKDPYLCLNIDTFDLELAIPARKFRDYEFNGEVNLTIISEGYSSKLNIFRAFGFYHTEPLKIVISENYFSEIKVCIESETKKEYVIKSRNYRLFNDQGLEITKMVKGINYLLVRNDCNISFPQDKIILDKTNFNSGTLYSLSVDDDTVLYINCCPVSLSGEFEEIPVFEDKISEINLFDKNNVLLTATRSHPIVYFKTKKEKAGETILLINNKHYKVANSDSCKEILIHNDYENLGISCDLNKLLPLEDKSYEVSVSVGSNNFRSLCKYVLLKNLWIQPDKPRYVFKHFATITILGEYNISPKNSEKIIDERNQYLFDLKNTHAQFTLDLDKTYLMVVPMKIFRWKFTNSEWYTEKSEYFWADNMNNDLYIDLPDTEKISIYLDKNQNERIYGELKNDVFRFNITDIINFINKSTEPWHFLYATYGSRGEIQRSINFMNILKTVCIKEFSITKNPEGRTECNASFFGEEKVYANIFDILTEKAVYQEIEIKNGFTDLTKLEQNKPYRYELFTVNEDAYGFSRTIKHLQTFFIVTDLTKFDLVIKKISFCDHEIKIDGEYTITNIYRNPENAEEFFGRIINRTQINKDVCLFSKVKIIKPMNQNKTFVLDHIEETDTWSNFVYDKQMKSLIGVEHDLLNKPGGDMDRFIFLYEDEVEFELQYKLVK